MSRYASAHANPKGPGDARPTALQIIKDEGLLGKLTDKIFLITGCSDGIGVETAKALHAAKATVFATGRNEEKTRAAIKKIYASDPENHSPIHYIKIDLSSLASVRAGAEGFLRKSDKLNVLINNAGMISIQEGRTVDGFETQFGTNHLGHFLLFQLLKSALLASNTPAFPSRVVSVSSTGHRISPIRFDDLNFEKEPYNEWLAYGQSKTANIYLANEIERRYGSKGLHATSVHPGVVYSNFGSHLPKAQLAVLNTPEWKAYMRNTEQGAATTVYAAVSKEWADKGGKYLADCVEQGPYRGSEPVYGSPQKNGDGYAAWVYDQEAESRLWMDSLKMVGLTEDD